MQASPSFATEVKLFNKWSFDDIEVGDISLEVCLYVKVYCTKYVFIVGMFPQSDALPHALARAHTELLFQSS
jgi:hypothetical protein